MKRLILVLTLIMIAATGTVLAAAVPTPVSHIPHTPTEKIHLRFSHQVAQIHKETKLGKLTKAQEKTLMANVETIRKQELAFLKADNSKVLDKGARPIDKGARPTFYTLRAVLNC